MDIRPIRTEANYSAALKTISRLMESDPEIGTFNGDRLDVPATLVQAYEAKHFLIDLPNPIEAIKFSQLRLDIIARTAPSGPNN